MTFERQMDETRGATAQITCWCITIALHQEFGVGADRLNRIQSDLEKAEIFERCLSEVTGSTRQNIMKWRV